MPLLTKKKLQSKKHLEMKTMFKRLMDLNYYITFYLLKHCLAIPNLTYILSTTSCLVFEDMANLKDHEIKSAL